ncbi:hypothetical protein [Macrococcoides canis]|uniref:Uncharacterized protein n=1 Tax=Macrococcoides canis TaxID=1855823 RepID=A0AAE6X0Y0_9STAP|nr:hypothetical protein [Macrococcus canis]QCT74820.1 hypothetical protein EST43_05945 [Macrococcus canis]QIH78421.1 hypothetical protein GTN30_07015 [Macrococcus canis]
MNSYQLYISPIKYIRLITFAGCSFSILNSDLTIIYDSQADFETITAEANKQVFNSEQESPTKSSLLLASHEMSGTIAVYELSSL